MRGAGRFRLLRYFTVASLVTFVVVAAAMYFLERAEKTFFAETQQAQSGFFARAQAELVREQKAAARANLVTGYQASHVTLTRLSANALWDAHFAPLVARAQRFPLDHCRSLPHDDLAARNTCFAEVGRRIRALPGFSVMDSAVHDMMRNSTVFKIKVYDLRGLTVYSSELAQIGEDKADNLGWASAVKGTPASELVHRDRFSAFEGEVENRDLVQSYVPVMAGGDKVAGVFEIYSDVTPLLAQIEALSARIGEMAAVNQANVDAVSLENQREVAANADAHFAILAGMFLALYLALLLLVRRGQRIIDAQERAREQAALREQQSHREKMAALATMAANASHEIGNPVAVISGLAQEIESARETGQPLGDQPRRILEQTARIAHLTRRINDFANARSETPEPVDVNQMIDSVCRFASFDNRYRTTRIEPQLSPQLPACIAIPGHLHEVLMILLQVHAEASMRASDARLLARSEVRGEEVLISIGGESTSPSADCAIAADDSRLDSARRRVEGMGGRLAPGGTVTHIFLRRVSSDAGAT